MLVFLYMLFIITVKKTSSAQRGAECPRLFLTCMSKDKHKAMSKRQGCPRIQAFCYANHNVFLLGCRQITSVVANSMSKRQTSGLRPKRERAKRQASHGPDGNFTVYRAVYRCAGHTGHAGHRTEIWWQVTKWYKFVSKSKCDLAVSEPCTGQYIVINR